MAGMALVFAIAFRNLGRNRWRTAIAGAAVAVGVSMCIASFGVMDGMSSDMVRSITEVELGHVEVHAPGFSSRPRLELSFDQAAQRAAIAAATPGVRAVSLRVRGFALASSAHASAGVELVGVDPAREAAESRLDRRVTSGSYLPATPTPWPKAQELSTAERALDEKLTAQAAAAAANEIEALGSGRESPDPPELSRDETRRLLTALSPAPAAPPPILLGDKLARRLGSKVDATVDLMTNDSGGNPVDVVFRVIGVVHTGDGALDGTRAVAHLADVQRLYGLGDRAHELALSLEDASQAREIARSLAREPAFRGLVVKTWQELRPDVVAMVKSNGAFTAIMVAIIFVVAAIGVADTILMAVFERRRELGVLKAVGMRPLAIVLMIATETALLGAGASFVGLGVGVGIDLLLGRYGIPLGGLSGFTLAGASIPPVLHATLTAEGALWPVGLMLLMAILASLWPAAVAARTEPALAMGDR